MDAIVGKHPEREREKERKRKSREKNTPEMQPTRKKVN